MQVVAIYYWIYGGQFCSGGGSNIPVHSCPPPPPPRQLCTGIILPPGSIVLGAVMFLYTGWKFQPQDTTSMMTLYKVVEQILCVIKLLCEVNPFHVCHFSSRTCIFNDYTMHDQPISFWCYLMNHRKRHTELSIIVPTTPSIFSIQQNHTGLVIQPPPPPVIEIINCRIYAPPPQ